jgi:hypothetical protein
MGKVVRFTACNACDPRVTGAPENPLSDAPVASIFVQRLVGLGFPRDGAERLYALTRAAAGTLFELSDAEVLLLAQQQVAEVAASLITGAA